MTDSPRNLGRLISVHGTSARSLQRASIVAILSFVFFLALLVVFYATGRLTVFILSSAFLVVYLFTMIGIWLQKRGLVRIYENGIAYGGVNTVWTEMARVQADQNSGVIITRSDGNAINIGPSISDLNAIAKTVKERLDAEPATAHPAQPARGPAA